MIAAAEKVFLSSLAWFRSTRPVPSLLVLAGFCPCCFGQLPTDLALPSETIDSGTLVFQASDSITNGGSLSVMDPASVTLTAGSYITLEPGFDAVATTGTATFHAVINPNVGQWQPIPIPSPPTACTDCGLNYADGSSGTNPQAVYAPNSTNNLYAYCTDWSYKYTLPCHISLSITAYEYTNGHFHSNPLPPYSSINPNYGYTGNYQNYSMAVVLTTTQVGQIETITVVNNDNGDVINYDYGVGYLGLVRINNSTIFNQIGGSTDSHGDNTWNHYMTVSASTGLQSATTFYINNYNPGQKICINDMALPIGGVFDYKYNDWQPPHASHDKGTAADVAVSSGQCQASYEVNATKFKQACTNAGAVDVREECGTTCHVHCRWPY